MAFTAITYVWFYWLLGCKGRDPKSNSYSFRGFSGWPPVRYWSCQRRAGFVLLAYVRSPAVAASGHTTPLTRRTENPNTVTSTWSDEINTMTAVLFINFFFSFIRSRTVTILCDLSDRLGVLLNAHTPELGNSLLLHLTVFWCSRFVVRRW